MYETSGALRTLVDIIKADETASEQRQQERKQEEVTTDILVKAAKEAATDKNPRYKMYELLNGRRFASKASDEKLLELAHTTLNEENETVKALLLNQFCLKPFPLDIVPLIEYAQSDNKLLAEVTINHLKEFKDKRLHDLAIQLLNTKGLKSYALALLINNYKKSDDEIISKAIKKSTSIPHHVQQDIRDVYLHHRSVNALPILLRVYQLGECGFCRHDVVKAMRRCRILPENILEECQYDSYEDTRKYAKRLLAKRW